jgi:hypothetical protein
MPRQFCLLARCFQLQTDAKFPLINSLIDIRELFVSFVNPKELRSGGHKFRWRRKKRNMKKILNRKYAFITKETVKFLVK